MEYPSTFVPVLSGTPGLTFPTACQAYTVSKHALRVLFGMSLMPVGKKVDFRFVLCYTPTCFGADAGIAQSVEQLIRNQQVVCSSHITSSM